MSSGFRVRGLGMNPFLNSIGKKFTRFERNKYVRKPKKLKVRPLDEIDES